MKLAQYLSERRMSASEFADRVGKDRSTVGRWIDGSARPRWDDIPKITEATNGAVTADDFVVKPGPEPPATSPVQQR
jgi:transcriptional regulator with XRE-family HTH domain